MAAYHTLARMLETAAYTPLPARKVFAAAVDHVLNGFVPTERFQHAGQLAGEKRHAESAMALMFADEVRVDLNPFTQCMVRATTRHGALLVHQSLNQLADLPVRTEVGFDNRGVLTIKSRSASSSGDDPAACRDAHLLAMDMILSNIAEPNAQTVVQLMTPAWKGTWLNPPESISKLAAMLGLGASIASDAALAFESDVEMSVHDVARHLGCHRRTLQREFKACGVTAETLKRACMLSGATALLSTPMSLTEIAHQTGYADHAHMTRAFVTSCGLPPSTLRKAFMLPFPTTSHTRG